MNRLRELFKEFKQEKDTDVCWNKNSRVLIVDGLNSFIRVFSAVPLLNENGEHVGGYLGFLRSLAAAIRQFKPTRCIVVFDGKGGSHRRKSMYSGYKDGRQGLSRFNRVEGLENTVEQEAVSMRQQMGRLADYLECLPLTTISIDNIEADDAIAYLATEIFEKSSEEVVIMSDDKDFIQLVSDTIKVWRPVEKKFYTKQDVVDKFSIPSHNFIHYKIFMGDGSDNIKGIKGIGIKTLVKHFPILLEDSVIELPELFKYCESRQKDHKIYSQVLESKDQLQLNWDLMSLKDLDISGTYKSLLRELSEREISPLNSFQLKRMILADKVYNIITNVDKWVNESFQILNSYREIL